MNAAADVLRDAARIIRERGKCSGVYYCDRTTGEELNIGLARTTKDAACCARGAIRLSLEPARARTAALQSLVVHLNVKDSYAVARWSDSIPDTPEGTEHVAATMEACATQLAPTEAGQ